jgi:hypothetical protein
MSTRDEASTMSEAAITRRLNAMTRARRVRRAPSVCCDSCHECLPCCPPAYADEPAPSDWQFPGLSTKPSTARANTSAVRKRYRGDGITRHSCDGARLSVVAIDQHITQRHVVRAELIAGAAPVALEDALLLWPPH